MKTEILDLKVIDKELELAQSTVSFSPFINYLKTLAEGKSVKSQVYESVIAQFESELTAGKELIVEESAKHKELLDLIYTILTPLVSSEETHLWALSTPIPAKIFYSTDAFFAFHSCESSCAFAGIKSGGPSARWQKAFVYRLILKNVYDLDFGAIIDTYIQGVNPANGQPLYYKIHVDTRFLEIHATGDLPNLDNELLESWLVESNSEEHLEKLLPLSLFEFKGFSIVDFTDVTEEHAIENLKNVLVGDFEHIPFDEVNQSLRTLAGKSNIDFGILPFVKINGRSVYLSEGCSRSIIMNSAVKYHISEDVFNDLVKQYEQNTEVLIYNKISEQRDIKHPFLKVLKYAGINSYALLPVFYHKQLLGVLEIYSYEKIFFDRALLARLQSAMPYIAQLLKQMADDFADTIENLVRDNFTALKSSVKWKFNEAAWAFLQDSLHNPSPKMGKIDFSQVYPFYGAIDIRQSTHERNKAAFEDISCQLEVLEDTLSQLEGLLNPALKTQFDLNLHRWKNSFQAYKSTKDEMSLIQLLEKEVDPFLEKSRAISAETDAIVAGYCSAISEEEGIAYKHRRELEASMQSINQSISAYLVKSQKELQATFPHYFEKFRTDGIEYNIYLGEAIAPFKEFNKDYVRQMRIWQLRSMAEIATVTRNLKDNLAKPLQTTQLIFVHSTPINISFRNDEKRFDVEGGYSIRYEVVKKRIDKVLIKNTEERLTQPEKIALVYFNQLEQDEYMDYIKSLQKEGILKDDLELLELVELQGVHGLKALRVGVK